MRKWYRLRIAYSGVAWALCLYIYIGVFVSICLLLPFVGGGQYGDVYQGIWKRHKKIVAVKTLKVFILSFFYFFFKLCKPYLKFIQALSSSLITLSIETSLPSTSNQSNSPLNHSQFLSTPLIYNLSFFIYIYWHCHYSNSAIPFPLLYPPPLLVVPAQNPMKLH